MIVTILAGIGILALLVGTVVFLFWMFFRGPNPGPF